MKQKMMPAYKELKTVGFIASQTGDKVNAVQGNYIRKRQNAETKGSGSCLKAGFIKNTETFNRWTRTRNIAVGMQTLLNNVLKIKMAPSTHKCSTPSGMRRHVENMKKLKNMVRNDYHYDFFANEPLKATTTGKEVPNDVAQHMLFSADAGNECMKTFVEKRLVKQEMNVFDKITKNQLNIDIKKPPKSPKPVEALKEDAQGFRMLAERMFHLMRVSDTL